MVKNNYETLYIVNQELGEETLRSIIDKFTALINANGEVTEISEWGRRRLAYPIQDLNDGYYVLVNFSAEPSFITELERIFKITDGIMRYIVIKK